MCRKKEEGKEDGAKTVTKTRRDARSLRKAKLTSTLINIRCRLWAQVWPSFTGCYEPMGTRFYELHANSSAATRRSLYPRRLFFGSPLSPSLSLALFLFRVHETTYHEVSSTPVRTSPRVTRIYPPFFLLFLFFFSSSHGQFSKVQRALIIEEAGANNPGWIPVCAGGRKEEEGGVVEDHHHCRGLDTTDHGIVVADGRKRDRSFLRVNQKEKEKCHKVSLSSNDDLLERFLRACTFAFNSYLFIRIA